VYGKNKLKPKLKPILKHEQLIPAVDTLPPEGPEVSTTILLDFTALTTCFKVKSALSFCSIFACVAPSSTHHAAEVRSDSRVGHLAGKSKRAMLAMSRPV